MSALVDVDLVLCMVTLPPLPIFPNNYMLKRRCGLKTQRQQANHETIIFQGMLDITPQQETQNGT